MSTEVIDDDAQLIQALSGDGPLAPTWAYVRVSSGKQAREGMSLEGQRDAIIAYCAEKNLAPPVIVREVGSAGKPLLNVSLPGLDPEEGDANARPLLTLLLAGLCDPDRTRRKGISFIVWKLDRLSRVGTEQEPLLRLLWRADVAVHSTWPSEAAILNGDGLDKIHPERALMRQIYGAFAQYERHLFAARSLMGMRAKAASGRWVSGTPPYGYRHSKSRDIEVHPDHAAIVVAIFCLRRQGMSMRQIRDLLLQRMRARIDHNRISRVLHNRELYEGFYIDPYGGQHPRPDLRVLPHDWDTWAEEQDLYHIANLGALNHAT